MSSFKNVFCFSERLTAPELTTLYHISVPIWRAKTYFISIDSYPSQYSYLSLRPKDTLRVGSFHGKSVNDSNCVDVNDWGDDLDDDLDNDEDDDGDDNRHDDDYDDHDRGAIAV